MTALKDITLRIWDDAGSDPEATEVESGTDYEATARRIWGEPDYGGGDYRVTVRWEVIDDDGSTIAEGRFVLEGQRPEPACPSGDEHDWTSEFEGGSTENPGVWSTGGTSMVFVSHCRNCGIKRRESTTGAQYNPGDCDTTEYGDPDPEWVAEHIG